MPSRHPTCPTTRPGTTGGRETLRRTTTTRTMSTGDPTLPTTAGPSITEPASTGIMGRETSSAVMSLPRCPMECDLPSMCMWSELIFIEGTLPSQEACATSCGSPIYTQPGLSISSSTRPRPAHTFRAPPRTSSSPPHLPLRGCHLPLGMQGCPTLSPSLVQGQMRRRGSSRSGR